MLSKPPWPSHGGQSAALLQRFGLSPDHPLEDFSANLNPLGPPEWVAEALSSQLLALKHYPEPDYGAAREAIAAYHGVAVEQVLLTNGGAEAIFLAAALHAGQRAGVLAPSFGEYARACHAYHMPVTSITLPAPAFALDLDAFMAALEGIDVVFLCRPNNPTATLISFDDMQALLARTAAINCRVVVDEAFIDLAVGRGEAASLTPLLADHPHMLLLRSMTKFFTLPGLRLGYVLASASIIRSLGKHQPAWSVNQMAAELVAPLLADQAFAERTRAWLGHEHPRMAAALVEKGLEVVPSTTNFFLVRPNNALRARGVGSNVLFERLLQRGLLVRHTHNFAGLDGDWVRIALRSSEANLRLLKVLNDCLC
ncbi:threonine-phosphate decarboxylase CobD [Vreelandella populi]|uniref:threonine-phosphate decarboxylase n=1 Tax=Vreelandella populi TaxID=2498858 RepID=A0A433LH83_9GAMM|nr:threonine-phosphate decarboxylase CobD [Halomonas populi]RUR40877.1 threonine-phosphate decarboxylase [Halomonas populi]RUR49385.1 threonine-phosphate decarboxylase [Halomonas populi]RUR55869.1 threonine-phosphate decarboxylase [Halomonas populi]